MIASSFRAPRVYGSISLPLLTGISGTIDYTKYGSTLDLPNILSLRRVNILEPGSDTLDIAVENQNGQLSSLTPNSQFGRYFYPGAVDNKVSIWMGLTQNGSETVLPKGVYIIDTFAQASEGGENTATLNCFDQMYMFTGTINAQFPPRLYGNQQGAYYNPNYALFPMNASGGSATMWGCDAVNWMVNSSDNPVWGSDFAQVQVYLSTTSNGTTPISNSLYTIDYNTGTITFTTAVSTSTTVSVDARPLGMAPEKALYHLFVDFGGFSPASLKLDNSGVVLPIMEIARDRSILDIAKMIAFATCPRNIRWRIYFNEDGSLVFTEDAIDGSPVRVLTDEESILKISPEFTANTIYNIVRAQGRSITDQPLTVVSFDVRSINIFSAKPTYDVPSDLLVNLVGMDPGSAMAYLNGLTASLLFEYSTPVIQTEIGIVPDPALQVDDMIWITENKTGIDRPFFIKQITEEVTAGNITQTLRIEQVKRSQDYCFGLGAYTGAPSPANPNTIQTNSNLIAAVSINGTSVVTAGQPNLDNAMEPVVPTWNGGSLPIAITVNQPPGGGTGYLWRWIYLGEDAYVGTNLCTGDGTSAGVFSSVSSTWGGILAGVYGSHQRSFAAPYDVNHNVDSVRSRRYFRPLLRCSDWLTNDGITGFTALTTYNSTWSGGVGASNPTILGQLIVGQTDFYHNTSSNYVGQALYATGTPAATVLGGTSAYKYGVDFGGTTNKTINYGIKRKVTPAYLCILCANTAGSVQYKRIPFSLAV